MNPSRLRQLVALLCSLLLAGSQVQGAAAGPGNQQLTNLTHLDFLGDDVSPPVQRDHTTYRLAEEPRIGVLWTYAAPADSEAYTRQGGGERDPQTGRWSQGAFNADDISRAAIVYVRHWRQHRDAHSRVHAYQLLRGLAYMQTTGGHNRGNVVLWMQPDGTLTPSALPRELPDPSDSGPSPWLARFIWALGEGYAAFKSVDPPFAQFLRARLDLALGALERQGLGEKYGRYVEVDGLLWPAWLIVDGADVTAEAVIGLTAYVRAGGGARARRALEQLAGGIVHMQLGGPREWPFRAIMPWARSRSTWHAWAGQMSGALADAGRLLGRAEWVGVAAGDVGSFTPHLLIQGGPDNGWLPAPVDRAQIAYGADSLLQNLLHVSDASGRRAFRDLAGVAASWYFGNNPSGQPMYDAATGRTFDGVNADGTINRNAGAESTIHGLLSMLALDANPGVALRARAARETERIGWQLCEAEAGRLDAHGAVASPVTAWTGEAQWSGGQFVEISPGSRIEIPLELPVSDQYLIFPVYERQALPRGALLTRYAIRGVAAGELDCGDAGPQGVTAVPGYLAVGTTATEGRVMAGPAVLTIARAGHGVPARLDAVLVAPSVEWLILTGPGRGQALLRSFSATVQARTITLPGASSLTARAYDEKGHLKASIRARSSRIAAPVLPGGFTIVTP